VTAVDGEDALRKLPEHDYSLILSDNLMPNMIGVELLERTKNIQPDATRVIVTAVLKVDKLIELINQGEIYRFIAKPWIREELIATVHNAVHRYDLVCRNKILQAATLEINHKLKTVNKELQENVERIEEQNRALEKNLARSVELCLGTMQTFYPVLGSQARRVHSICKSMAEELDLPEDQTQILEIAAYLHDIGLVGVPRGLIKKWDTEPGQLDEAELKLLQHHTVYGQELATFVHDLKDVGIIIRAHHERYDGRGFPDQLRGDNIPWLARLLSVAVAFAEADRTDLDAVTKVKLKSGSAFDPEAVRVFLRALPRASVPRRQRQVLLSELQPGMVLANGIYTSNGMLLIPEGLKLNDTFIDKLRNHNNVNPINQSLLVYC